MQQGAELACIRGQGQLALGGEVSMQQGAESACLFGHGILGGFADEWRVHCGETRGFQCV